MIKQRLMRLERKLSGQNELTNILIKYNPDQEKQKAVMQQALNDRGLTSEKNVIFVIHYGNKPPETWKEEYALKTVVHVCNQL
jgi:hypothetical protein